MKAFSAINGFFDRLYRQKLGRLLLSVLMVSGVFAFAFWQMEPAYLVNDDTNIAFALAGYRTGAPFAAHPFIHIALGFLISRLYGLFPAVPWWFVAQEAAIFVSAIVLALCVLRVAARRNVHWLPACMLFGVLFVGLLFRPIIRVSFTLTASALGTAAVALLLGFERTEPRPLRTWFGIFSGMFLLLSFLFRNSSGVSLACFYFAALLYRILDAYFFGKAERRQLSRRIGALTLGMVLLIGVTVGVNQYALKTCNAEGYLAFDEARADFVDYRLCDTYADNPALYASVGWDASLYDLANQWCFMDEHVTTEALETLIASSQKAEEPLTVRLLDVLPRIHAFLDGDYFARLMLVLPPAVLFASLVLLLLTKRRDQLSFVFVCCMLLGGTALIGYLAFCDRLILRTFRLVLMPACFASALLTLRILPLTNEPVQKEAAKLKHAWRSIVSCVLCAFALLFGGLMSGRALMDTLRSDYSDEIAASRAVIDYCIAHKETVFIRDTATCSSLDALSTYPDQDFVNMLSWGDTDMLTGVQKAQLDRLGFEDLNMELFRLENVRYLGTTDSAHYAAFCSYLAARHATLVQTDEIAANIGVFRVVFDAPAA